MIDQVLILLKVMLMLFLLNMMMATPAGSGGGQATGLEWMVVASFLVPAVLIAVLLYLGARHTV